MRRAMVATAIMASLFAVAGAAHAYELSVADWWTTTYAPTYGSFASNWEWTVARDWSDGSMENHSLEAEFAGYANTNQFGWLDYGTQPKTHNLIFDGGVYPGGPGAVVDVIIPSGAQFGFYLRTDELGGSYWNTNPTYDNYRDSYDYHAWVFEYIGQDDGFLQGNEAAYLFGWEDLGGRNAQQPWVKQWKLQNDTWVKTCWGGKEQWWTDTRGEGPCRSDNQDMIVIMRSKGYHYNVPPVPEPASLCLLGLAGGAIATMVKKRRKA